jgi:hypothetical protein
VYLLPTPDGYSFEKPDLTVIEEIQKSSSILCRQNPVWQYTIFKWLLSSCKVDFRTAANRKVKAFYQRSQALAIAAP